MLRSLSSDFHEATMTPPFVCLLLAFTITLLAFSAARPFLPARPRRKRLPLRARAKSFALFLLLPVAILLSSCGSGSNVVSNSAPIASLGATSYTFNGQMTGTTSAAQSFTMSNIGTAPLQVSSVALSGTNGSSFSVTTGANSCASTLAAGASCFIYVTFNPPSVANCSATVTITDNSTTPMQTIALTGAATPGPGAGQTPDTRAAAMLTLMTQAEKLQMVQGGVTTNNTYGYTVPRGAGGFVPGNTRLSIPELYLADGSVGVGNGVGPATALPSSIANAASWDLNEATKYGNIIGTELADYGINVNLGGNTNLIGREPRDGRTFETKGEDPILAGKFAAAHISAIQAQHIIGDIKHFSFNDQESGRTTANAIIDERSGRESDLLAFEIGVKDSGVQSVMCSYNLTNGQYDCENEYLLNQVLKGDWNFPGFVMSDWWATQSTVNAALNGLDQEQPNQQYFSVLGQAITNGQVPQSRLDNMVQRILRAMYAVGLFDNPQTIQTVPFAADAAVAQELEESGAVLLMNNNNLLPLNASTIQSIAVISGHADTSVLSGGGSAQVQPNGGGTDAGMPCPPCWANVVWDPSSPLKAIQSMAPNATVTFNDGTDVASAAALAQSSQVAIVFVTVWSSEGMDQPSIDIRAIDQAQITYPGSQASLLQAVVTANPNTIVVLENGGPVYVSPANQVGALLEAWYPGQNGGPAIADLLFGKTNPSGKLPVTFPMTDSQLPRPSIPQPPADGSIFPVNYTEGYNVGYKWFDENNLTPWFPFGFGLSYTTFNMKNAQLVNNLNNAANPNFQVTFTLTNTGTRAGAEVPQVYLGMAAALNEPPKRLVGWQKVSLNAGAAQQVTIEVDQNDSSQPMSYWNTTTESWTVAPGVYTVYLANSSAPAALVTVGSLTVN
jgi:beta-glucosidase